MKCINYIRVVFYVLRKCNTIKTVFINFKMLPFNRAIKLPIYVYGKTIFRSLSGSLEIKGEIHTGMIKIGKNDYYVKTSVPLTNWVLNGKLIFNGPFKFLNGGYLCISKSGFLEFGENGLIGSDYKIMCFDHISVGHTLRAAYNVSIYDTSYHYILLDDGTVNKLTSSIYIGDKVWIGNNVIISKGAYIPTSSIISNSSFVNKNYKEDAVDDSGAFIAGCPAKVKKTGMHRIFDEEEQMRLDKQFGYDRTHL